VKTKNFFMSDGEYPRAKALILLVLVVFAIGLVTGRYGTEVGWWYVVGIFGAFAAISVGLIYHYREEEDEE
jgi:type IV secretory pathway VirB2 component (pilin)